MKTRTLIPLLFFALLVSHTKADTYFIQNLDVRDVWQYNYNLSHWIEQGNLRTGVPMYGEEPEVTITAVPASLLGCDWIQTASGSRRFDRGTIASFELKYGATVYIAHSDAITVKPAWLKKYKKTDRQMKNSAGGTFTFYSKDSKAGSTVELGENGSADHPMYLVAVEGSRHRLPDRRPAGKVFDIGDFGAKGDGRTPDTEAIRKAVDACAEAGGGTVYVHDGIFVTGTILLRDNVTLWVAEGTILRGSAVKSDYPPIRCSLPSFRAKEDFQLIYAEGASNVAITGGGVIDGYSLREGYPWHSAGNNEWERPRLIRMVCCKNVSIRNITLVRSANWTQYYEGCEGLTVENVNVRCYTGTHNQDGIDVSGCRDVLIRNFNAVCGDDVVCLKAMSMLPGEHIRIEGVRSRYANCNLLKIGTETHSAVRDVRATDLSGCARYGLAIESVDGAVVEDITYENIILSGCGAPLEVRLGSRNRTFEGGPVVVPPGKIRNVTLRNIVNTDIGYVEDKGGPGVGAPVGGIPGNPIENVTIENCDFTFYGTIHDPQFVYRDIPENAEKYPTFTIYGTCPAYGIYFRHVDGMVCRNVTLRLKNRDIRPAIVLDDVKNYTLNRISAVGYPDTEPSVLWHRQDGPLTAK